MRRTSDGTSILLVEARTRDVSSTAIRARLAARQPIDDLVPAAVARHIVANNLYASGKRLAWLRRIQRGHGRRGSRGCRRDRDRPRQRSARERRRRRAAEAAEGRGRRGARGARQEGRGRRRARPAEGRRLHRLLRDLHRDERAADLGDRGRRQDTLKQDLGERPTLAEGVEKSEWILLDYFNFVVHVFSRECRAFYGLERLWGNAERHEFADDTVRAHDVGVRPRGDLRVPRMPRAAYAARPHVRPATAHAAADALLAVTLAPRCAACGACSTPRGGPGLRGLLVVGPRPRCRRSAAPAAIHCRPGASSASRWSSAPAAAGTTLAIECGRAAGDYEGALREIIHAFKYDGRRSLARASAA